MPSFRVRLFAAHREAAGEATVEVELAAGATVADLVRAVEARVPAIAKARLAAVVSVNGEFAPEGQRLEAHDDVALFPPVAGG